LPLFICDKQYRFTKLPNSVKKSPKELSGNLVGIFRKLPDVFFFPQLWKRFFTTVVNVYYNCRKPFPQLWKEKNIGIFTEKDANLY